MGGGGGYRTPTAQGRTSCPQVGDLSEERSYSHVMFSGAASHVMLLGATAGVPLSADAGSAENSMKSPTSATSKDARVRRRMLQSNMILTLHEG